MTEDLTTCPLRHQHHHSQRFRSLCYKLTVGPLVWATGMMFLSLLDVLLRPLGREVRETSFGGLW